MAASIRCFIDKECTRELPRTKGGNYDMLFAASWGLNGSYGEYTDTVIYVKNCGTRAALNVRVIIETSELANLFLLSDNFLGDIKEREVKTLTFRAKALRGDACDVFYPVVIFDYYTLPDIEEERFNPYIALREFAEEVGCEVPDFLPLSETQLLVMASVPGYFYSRFDTDGDGEISTTEIQRLSVEFTQDQDTYEAIDILKMLGIE